MLELPIAERELRIGARSSGTYRSRWNIAAVLFLAFAGIYWNLDAFGGWANRTIFLILSGLCFAYALLAGLILAADAISSEKRDGTLGLLFLTALKPIDLIAGSISATSLKAFYGLLATFPVLGLSLLMGGIEYAEFARVCGALVTTLLFSLSLCLFVSCLSRRRLPAISRSALALFFFVGALPMFTEAIKDITRAAPPRWIEVLSLCSPTITLQLCSRPWFTVHSEYWLSLILIISMSFAMLMGSCFLLPWIWKDRAPIRFFAKRTEQRVKRRKLGAQNPFFWLASRQSWESTRFLIVFLALALFTAGVGSYSISRGPFGAFEDVMTAWTFLLVGAHAVLIFKFAALSTARLAEDRELGALESILVTPVRVREILRGQCHALATQLGGPAIAVLFVHGLLFWGFLVQYSLENGIAGGALGVLRMAADEIRHGSAEPWSLIGTGSMIVESFVLAILAWIALASVGMWIALRARHASRTLWFALAAVLIPPTAAFLGLVSFGVWLDLHRGNGSFWGWFCLLSFFGFSATNSLGLTLYACFKLRKYFRKAATERFSRPVEHNFTAVFRWPIRVAGGAIAILLLFFLIYSEEKFRGLRAWRAAQAKYQPNFRNLASFAKAPPAIPDSENFGAAALFKPLFDYRYESPAQVVWNHPKAQEEAMTITVTGTRQGNFVFKTNFNPAANWELQKPTDFAALQKFYQASSVFNGTCLTNVSPAQSVLRALSVFDAELSELEEASHRPKTRFPIHYEETHAAYWMHLPFLKNIANVVALRATARLADGDIAGGRRDIEFCIRLANSFQKEPGVFPARVRKLILLSAMNPLWEGFSRNQWDEDSLRTFQNDFAIDVLTDYPRVIREQTLGFLDMYDRIAVPDEKLLERSSNEPLSPRAARFYPVGWKYLNQAGLMRLAEETMIPLIDPANRRVLVDAVPGLAPAIRHAHVVIDPVSQRVIPWELQMYQDVILDTAHAQASLDEAALACALERWRLKHGSFPAELKLLTPEFLTALPRDPITGGDYQYKVSDGGKFILYSVGWNRTDESGQAVAAVPGDGSQDLHKGDWVWKY